jgi:DNA-binding MarR family transcriptional regulator
MERRVEREFEILTAIAEESSTTQRVLAARLGVALGLTNLYLKRLVKRATSKSRGFHTGRPRESACDTS